MKLIKNLLKVVTVALYGAFILASCNNLTDKPAIPEGAYLRGSAAPRSTLLPEYSLDDFSKYVLTGDYLTKEWSYSENNYVVVEEERFNLGQWESYADFASAYIAIPKTGNWNFVLDAYTDDETYFSSTVKDVTINDGANTVNFPLKAKEYALDSETQGGFQASFKLSNATFSVEKSYYYADYNIYNPDYSVSAIIKKGEDLETSEVISSESLDLKLQPVFNLYGNELSDEERFGDFDGIQNYTGDFIATCKKTEIASGIYWVTFSVNKGSVEGIVTKTVMIYVADGKITTEETGTDAIEAVLANDVIADEAKVTFTISYNYNGGNLVDGYEAPTSYNSRDTEATVLPTADNFVRAGYVFLGWAEVFEDDSIASEYTSQLLSDEDYIVEGNREYKAIWKWDTSQTVAIAKNSDVNGVSEGNYESQTFSWEAVPGASGYYLYYRESEDDDWEYVTSITNTYYKTLPSFNNDKYFAVKAYNSDEGLESDAFGTSVKYNQLSVLTAPVVTKTDDVLSWEPVYGATEYRIYKCESAGETQLTNDQADSLLAYDYSIEGDTIDGETISASDTLTYNIVSKFDKYVYYAVKAYNDYDDVESTYRQIWSTPKAPAPFISYSEGVLTWNAVNEATSYYIYSYVSASADIASVTSDWTCEFTKTASSEATYSRVNESSVNYLYLALKAGKDNSETNTTVYTDYSNIIKIEPIDFSAPVISLSDSEIKGDRLITWEAIEGASGGYNVYYWNTSEAPEDVTVSAVLANGYQANTTNLYYTVNLNSATDYVYVIVKPYSSYDNAEGPASNLITLEPLNLEQPSSINSAATDTPGTKRISWDEVEDATGYRVYLYYSNAESVYTDTIVGSYYNYNDTTNTYYEVTNTSTSDYLYVAVQPYFARSSSYSTVYGTASSPLQIEKYVLQPPVVSIEYGSSPRLSWNSVPGANSYYIYSYASDENLDLDSFDTDLLSYVNYTSNSYYYFTPGSANYIYFAVTSYNGSATDYSAIVKYCLQQPPVISWSTNSTIINFSTSDRYDYIYKYTTTDDLDLDNFDTSVFTEYVTVSYSSSYSSISLPEAGYYDYYAVKSGNGTMTSDSFSNVIKAYAGDVSDLQESHTSTYYFTDDGTGTWKPTNKGVHSSNATSTWTISDNVNVYYTYYWTVSSESNYDKLTISANGTNQVSNKSGTDYGTITGYSADGLTIQATYYKDTSASSGSDQGTIEFRGLWYFVD